MPLYEYQCNACGARFERIRKFSDPPLEICPTCGAGPVEKLISSPAFQFKGSGWYITDYARKSGAGDSSAESKSDPKSESKPAGGGEGAGDKESKSDKADKPSAPAAKESGTSEKPAATTSTSSKDS
jgi:putative FmdB family regulatory protein